MDSWYPTNMFANAGSRGEPIATPSVCLYIVSLKLNSTDDVELSISSINTLPLFCKREHLKMFPFVKIDIFVQSRWSRSGKNFKPLTRLVCELSIISINNFAKGNIFILTITSQQLFFTIENFICGSH